MQNHQKSIYYEGRYYYPRGNGYYYNSHLRKYLHQMVWITERGPIPRGYEIHHKDFNRENNDISNLTCISVEEHRKLHADLLTEEDRQWRKDNLAKNARPKASEWHKSEEGREWHRQHVKNQIAKGQLNKKMMFKCSMCGKEFESIARNLNSNHFCSNNCKARFLRHKRAADKSEKRLCVSCGKEFMASPWSDAKTCSNSCACVLRARTIKEEKGLPLKTKPLF